jgi:molybdopterin-guanine dinucleotide biosynthesis protein A
MADHIQPSYFATAVVLAGGKSSRMGTDKALLKIGGNTMIELALEKFRASPAFTEILVSSNEPERLAFTGASIVCDRTPNLGPIEGILSVLHAARQEYVCFLPCDAPLIPAGLPEILLSAANGNAPYGDNAENHGILCADDAEHNACGDDRPEEKPGYDAAVPVFEGRKEPLLSCLRKTMIPILENLEQQGIRKVAAAFAHPSIRVAEINLGAAELRKQFGDPRDYLANANDPEAFREIQARFMK